MDDKKLQQEGENVFQQANFANEVNIMRNNFKTLSDTIKIIAELRKIKYDSLINQGFKKGEALEIICRTKVLE